MICLWSLGLDSIKTYLCNPLIDKDTMTDVSKSKAYSLKDGRQLVAVTESGEDELVQMEELLERAVGEFGSESFSTGEFQSVLNEFVDGYVTRDGCKEVLRPLLDPGLLGGPQLGTGANWNYKLASSVRSRHED